MSKILRRPMFRGGGKVSSYGNGITSPLVPGYAGGGQIGGGAIYGELMPDGRYGFQAPKLYNAADQVAQAQLANVSPGMEYLESLKNIKEGNIPMIPINIPREKPIQNDIIDTTKEIDISGGYMEEDPPEGNLMTEYENWEDVPISIKNIPFSKDIFENQKKKKENSVVGRDLDYQDNLMQENYDTAQEAAKKISTLNFNDNNDNTEESTVLSTKDAITENQELFKELLGSKKARGQDIADMLLRFSGSEGDTVGEKFKNYTKAEAAAGPGRNEKISQTAAGLAINDYVAGKRSKEQAEVYKGKVDYEYKQKAKIVNVQPGDSAQTALFKIGAKGKVKPDSDKAYKFLIEMKTGSDKTFRIDKVKMKDLEKPKSQKKLKIGFNIIEEDGRKNIVQWDGTNYNILSISELWEG